MEQKNQLLEPRCISSTLSLLHISSKKIDHLIDYQHEPSILPTHLPLLNLYLYFQKKSFSFKSILTLMKFNPLSIKEYVQSFKMDSYLILASPEKQYVGLIIPTSLILDWLQERYTHIHFGAIKIIDSLWKNMSTSYCKISFSKQCFYTV